ncbi:MAG: PLDc N-terminal domain-containing protein [Chthoniobacterales bacterium]
MKGVLRITVGAILIFSPLVIIYFCVPGMQDRPADHTYLTKHTYPAKPVGIVLPKSALNTGESPSIDIGLVILAVVTTLLWIVALAHMLTNRAIQGSDRFAWGFFIIFSPLLGGILYLVMVLSGRFNPVAKRIPNRNY